MDPGRGRPRAAAGQRAPGILHWVPACRGLGIDGRGPWGLQPGRPSPGVGLGSKEGGTENMVLPSEWPRWWVPWCQRVTEGDGGRGLQRVAGALYAPAPCGKDVARTPVTGALAPLAGLGLIRAAFSAAASWDSGCGPRWQWIQGCAGHPEDAGADATCSRGNLCPCSGGWHQSPELPTSPGGAGGGGPRVLPGKPGAWGQAWADDAPLPQGGPHVWAVPPTSWELLAPAA